MSIHWQAYCFRSNVTQRTRLSSGAVNACDQLTENSCFPRSLMAKVEAMNEQQIAIASRILLQLYLERELARWESVGLGWAYLRTLPE